MAGARSGISVSQQHHAERGTRVRRRSMKYWPPEGEEFRDSPRERHLVAPQDVPARALIVRETRGVVSDAGASSSSRNHLAFEDLSPRHCEGGPRGLIHLKRARDANLTDCNEQ